jgi:hypothetical protein
VEIPFDQQPKISNIKLVENVQFIDTNNVNSVTFWNTNQELAALSVYWRWFDIDLRNKTILYVVLIIRIDKGRLSYHLCVEYFSQLSKSETAADFVYISKSNESWEKHSTQRW